MPNGDNITIAQLLDMRSGLQSYTVLESFNQAMDDEPAKAWDPEELVGIGLGEPVSFAPGTGFKYSNTNTVLAGLIVEQVTGMRLEDVFAERIFDPLGMENTLLPAVTDGSIPEPHPQGYMFGTNVSTITLEGTVLPEDEQAEAIAGTLLPTDYTDLNPSWGWAAGAAISTVGDLATYVEALVGGGLLSDDLQQQRLDSVVSVDPDSPQGAGYGLAMARFGTFLGHDGSLPGFRSFMGHDPATGTTLIVATTLRRCRPARPASRPRTSWRRPSSPSCPPPVTALRTVPFRRTPKVERVAGDGRPDRDRDRPRRIVGHERTSSTRGHRARRA